MEIIIARRRREKNLGFSAQNPNLARFYIFMKPHEGTGIVIVKLSDLI